MNKKEEEKRKIHGSMQDCALQRRHDGTTLHSALYEQRGVPKSLYSYETFNQYDLIMETMIIHF